MTDVYSRLPNVLGDIIARNLHELNMADVLTEYCAQDLLLRRLQIIMQHYASEGRIRLTMLHEGKVGQAIYLIYPLLNDEVVFDGNVGCSWNTFDEEQDDWMAFWRQNGIVNASDPEFHYSNDEWNQLSEYEEINNNGTSRVCLWLRQIPDHPDFAELEELQSGDHFVTQYPGFIPVYVTLPTQHIINENIVLTTMQRAIKYGFKETADNMTQMMRSAVGLTFKETHDIFASIMEHLIQNPAILIHSPRFRNKLYQKIAEMLNYIKEHTTDDNPFYNKYSRIQRITYHMKDVLKGIKADPLYNMD